MFPGQQPPEYTHIHTDSTLGMPPPSCLLVTKHSSVLASSALHLSFRSRRLVMLSVRARLCHSQWALLSADGARPESLSVQRWRYTRCALKGSRGSVEECLIDCIWGGLVCTFWSIDVSTVVWICMRASCLWCSLWAASVDLLKAECCHF